MPKKPKRGMTTELLRSQVAKVHDQYQRFFDLFEAGVAKRTIARKLKVSVQAIDAAFKDLDWSRRSQRPKFKNKNPEKELKRKHTLKLEAQQRRRERNAEEEEPVDVEQLLREMSTEELREMKDHIDADPDYEDKGGLYPFLSKLLDEREQKEAQVVVKASGSKIVTIKEEGEDDSTLPAEQE